MKIKLIQYYTSNCEYAVHTVKINQLYCTKYDIDYSVLNNDNTIISNNEERSLKWYKIKFINETLQNDNEHDYIIFVDADAFFVNHNKDIRDIINLYLTKNFIIAWDWGDHNIVNSGVMIFKNNIWSIDFLERVWKAGQLIAQGAYLQGAWHEQTIISTFMVVNSHDRNETQILDPYGNYSINDLSQRPETLIFHDVYKNNGKNIYKNIIKNFYNNKKELLKPNLKTIQTNDEKTIPNENIKLDRTGRFRFKNKQN